MATYTYMRENGQKVVRVINTNKCDNPYCFRQGATTYYSNGTPVLFLCQKHSRTDKEEVYVSREG